MLTKPMITKPYYLTIIIALCMGLVSCASFFILPPIHYAENPWLYISLMSWGGLLLLSLLSSFKYPVAGILFSGLSTVTFLRITGVYDFYLINIPAIAILFLLFIAFIFYSRDNQYSLQESTLTFIRMYIGFDIAAHAAEKLFAGIMPFQQVVQAFVNLHVPYPAFFVTLAGLCEFGAAIALGLGLLTRLGAIAAALYLVIATYLGNHFLLGFIWANAGGGWEYPVLWTVFTLIFAVLGGGRFSLDYLMTSHYSLPKWYYALCGQEYKL